MFETYAGQVHHIPRHPAVPLLVSSAIQTVMVSLAVVLPMLIVTDNMPEVPAVMAFVAAAPLPPAPPPPPPAASRDNVKRPVPTAAQGNPDAAPITAPVGIEEEPASTAGIGVEGGVPGGIPGGIPGGLLGGIPDAVPIPPPTPLAPRRPPLRVGGQIKAPALLHRVEPKYPEFAVQAKVEGVVILEAQVNSDGQVADVRVLRSAGILDRFAIDAVKQWRYSPVFLNGRPEPFLLTVTLSFSLKEPSATVNTRHE